VNTLITPTIAAKEARYLLLERGDLPETATVTIPLDTRQLTMPLADYRSRTLEPIVGGLMLGIDEGRYNKTPEGIAEGDGIKVTVTEFYDIKRDATFWQFRMTRE